MAHALTRKQRFETRLARSILGLPASWIARLAGKPIERDGNRLDPQVQLVLALARITQARPAMHVSVAAARSELEGNSHVLAPAAPAIERMSELAIATAAATVPARLYRPAGLPRRAPALVYLHGGGFVLGSLDSHDVICRLLAARAACVVIAIDYRLAPEHRFPAAAEDAVAAFRWVVQEADRLALDPARIAVGGDSAGGNLAAVIAQQTRDDPHPPRFQLLIYPAVDMTLSFPSIQSLAKGFFLERETIDWFLANYLPAGADRRDPRASPFFGDVARVAPAFVLTAGFDPLRDEGEAYARKMEQAGVKVQHRCYRSLFHGFFNASGGIDAAREPVDDAVAALLAAFRSPPN